MTSNRNMAEVDAATEALILQLIAQDFGVAQYIVPDTSSLPEQLGEPDTQLNTQADQEEPSNIQSSSQVDHPNQPNQEEEEMESDSSHLNNNQSEANSTQSPHPDNIDIEKMPKRSRETAGLEPSSSPNRRRSSSAIDGTSLALRGQQVGSATDTGVSEHTYTNDDIPPSGDIETKRAKVTNESTDGWEAAGTWESPRVVATSGSQDDEEWLQPAEPTTTGEPSDSWGPAGSQEQAGWGQEPAEMDDLEHDRRDTGNATDSNNADVSTPEAPEADKDAEMSDEGDSADGSGSDSEDQNNSNLDDSLSPYEDGLSPYDNGYHDTASEDHTDDELFDAQANINDHYDLDGNGTPFFKIPWPGVPGWMEAEVYESHAGYSLNDLDHRRGGPRHERMLANQQRMREEEPVDIVLEEHETADYQFAKMIKKEDVAEVEARRKAKGKGRVVD